jgi:thioester reductase-like protein
MSRAVFLTGATGFVGGDLLSRLIQRDSGLRAYCLIRARDAHQLEARRRALLAHAGIGGEDAERVIALAGDVVHPDLGLGERRDEVAGAVDEIYHIAASTKFDLELADARAINRDGAAHILAFARRAQDAGGLRRLHHVSTAYVAGNREGTIAEDGASGSDGFRNTYERSKWESEQLLSLEGSGVPITCYRPSIVVGDSTSGRTLHFRVLYDPMRWVYSGKIAILPCRPQVRLDVVPVDYVCDALLAIGARDDSEGGLYHLTSGPEGAMSIAEIVAAAVAEANRHHDETGAEPIAAPTIVSPDDMPGGTPEERENRDKIFALGESVMGSHVPYMLTEQLFDTQRTRHALRDTDVRCPPLRDYFDRIVRWGVERSFSAG